MRLLPVVVLIACAGCATILSSSSTTISIDSEPSGQAVTVDGAEYKTPAEVLLGRDKDHVVTFADGQVAHVQRGFNGLFLLNILLGGIPGMIVDLISGDVSNELYPTRLLWKDGKVYYDGKIPGEKPPKPADPRRTY